MRNTMTMVAILLSCFGSLARADKLQDFKDAVAASPGCSSIPYSDLSKTCSGRGDVMHEWCDGQRGPITCDQGTTRTLNERLEKERQNLEKLKEKKHDLEDKRYHSSDDTEKSSLQAEIEAVGKQIDESERTMNAIRNDLDKRKAVIATTISTIETCIDHRRSIMNIFADALDKVRNENDDDIKPLARTLRDRFEESKRGHEQAITAKENAKANCKSEAP